MKLNEIASIGAAVFFICASTTKAEDLAVAKADLVALQSEIQTARAEDAQYSDGLVKALIAARIATLRQTEAMLQQKLLSLKIGTPVRYTVDGKAFSLPVSAEKTLADVETEMPQAKRRFSNRRQR